MKSSIKAHNFFLTNYLSPATTQSPWMIQSPKSLFAQFIIQAKKDPNNYREITFVKLPKKIT